ncbi:MAG: GNVR domain-containing protein, partial [candidate division WOR-3 bacterium]
KLNEQQKSLLTEASQTSYNVLVDLKRQLTTLENEKANLLIQGYSPEDQKILRINQSIQSLKEKMGTVAKELLQKEGTLDPLVQMEDFMQQSVNLTIDYAVARSRIEALEEALRYYKERLNRIPKRDLELARLEREKEANKKIYLMLLEKREQAQITEVRESGGISILEFAQLPKGPNTMSKIKKSVLFFILGILMGIGGGFIVDYVDSAVRDEFEITRISGLPILGRIPVVENDKKGKNKEILINEEKEIQPISVDGLKVIPSGELPPNPSELLDSDRMKDLLKKWKKEYDIVLLDSPPLMTVSDSRILAAEVEETLLVAAYGETNRHLIAQTSELLKQLSIRALGYVLNKVDIHKEYGYYGYYYGYYYQEKSKTKS